MKFTMTDRRTFENIVFDCDAVYSTSKYYYIYKNGQEIASIHADYTNYIYLIESK